MLASWVSVAEAKDDVVEDMDTSEPNWAWFYLAECGRWHIFGTDPFATSSVSSDVIEQSYNSNRRGVMEFCTNKYAYRIDFAVMKQTNITTGKQRAVKRALQSGSSFRSICDSPAVPVPCHWEKMNSEEPYQLIPLVQDTHEFQEVKGLYERTMSSPIRSIRRIQNSDLWEFFCRKRVQLKRIKNGVDIEERMLFHGTASVNIQAICTFNFDWRLAGSHGCVYGKGSYFARDAKYSSKYCNSSSQTHKLSLLPHGLSAAPPSHHKCMFLARVLVGEYAMGSNSFVRPPSKDDTLTNVFDSCVDDLQHPKIFVVFDSNQTYPEYLIEFEEA
ncbi:protein mono-ADP-ribosyltransferase PARP11 [Clupea harengus]|uniref:Poly [ADP-ribose] polymerase n=1 Tax=Clupea harengus TaxID=7950 RepID=A0A6P8F599_CLUHA|nr:protein mono-ADP-ribosyltransferase PARP11 [Clupea harengus]XP_031418287.1 protein mono-ADP-ribosyltransferase PARP11 [Clupea harengus]XP_031418288.1 protein mono-ADP-ribosyltransferase PARP11 [Clupea harengus]